VNAIIVTIGDEITSGLKPDTNAPYLAAQLGKIGIAASSITSVGDDKEQVVAALRRAARDSSIVIATGGLGPTDDDITRQALSEALGTRLVVDRATLARIEERFAKRGLKAPEAVKAMALVPEGARVLANPAGTAPALAVSLGEARVYVLPGVPAEMKAIFEAVVAGELAGLGGRRFIKSRMLRTLGITESEIAAKLEPRAGGLGCRLAYLPEDIGVDLTLTAESQDEDQALEILERASGLVLERVGDRVYSTGGEEINFVVGKMLIESRTSIAVAESCTGGLVSHLLTEVAGISASLDRAVVAYDNRAKTALLGVSGDLLDRHGAVSAEVAEAMARGVRESAGTDLGLSTTGIAGPSGGTDLKPVGLVYMALAGPQGCDVARHVLAGSRQAIKKCAAARALDMVRCFLLEAGRKR
jgi:nicotinamide-nucleotide amidase